MATLTRSYDPLHQIIQPVHDTVKAMALNLNEVVGVNVMAGLRWLEPGAILSVARRAHREPCHARQG
jgi:hypothetical protein